MRKLTTNGIATAEAIGRREPFTTYGALSAAAGRPTSSGRLDGADRDRFWVDRADIVYVVLSYATPIGWVTSDGSAYRVTQRFSVTTTRHQSNLYKL